MGPPLFSDGDEIEKLRESLNKKEPVQKSKSSGGMDLKAFESRLLTRGPGNRQMELMEIMSQSLLQIREFSKRTDMSTNQSKELLAQVDKNTAGKVQMEIVS